MEQGNGGEMLSLRSDNLILKGCIMRNTEYIYGFAVYTGHDTKVMMNSSKPRVKWSQLEQATSKSILIILLTQSILSLIAQSLELFKPRAETIMSNILQALLQIQLASSWCNSLALGF